MSVDVYYSSVLQSDSDKLKIDRIIHTIFAFRGQTVEHTDFYMRNSGAPAEIIVLDSGNVRPVDASSQCREDDPTSQRLRKLYGDAMVHLDNGILFDGINYTVAKAETQVTRHAKGKSEYTVWRLGTFEDGNWMTRTSRSLPETMLEREIKYVGGDYTLQMANLDAMRSRTLPQRLLDYFERPLAVDKEDFVLVADKQDLQVRFISGESSRHYVPKQEAVVWIRSDYQHFAQLSGCRQANTCTFYVEPVSPRPTKGLMAGLLRR